MAIQPSPAVPSSAASPVSDRERQQTSASSRATSRLQTSPASIVRCQASPVRSFCRPGSQGALGHVRIARTTATSATPATTAVTTSSIGDDGSGSPSRIARSLTIQRR